MKETRWYLINEKGLYTIRNNKQQRYPIEKYRSIRENPEELKKLILRLNYEINRQDHAKKSIQLRHAFIDDQLLTQYRELLYTQISNPSSAGTEFLYVYKYFLFFFIHESQIVNPVEWHRIHKTSWASWLIKNTRSVQTKKHIVQAANKFMEWLHIQRPSEVPPLKFQPFTKARIKEMKASRRVKGEERVHQVITDSHWKIILATLPNDLKGAINLYYHFGLRRSEALGLKLTDIKKDFLYVERQLIGLPEGEPKYGPPKGRDARAVPYWQGTPDLAYQWVSEIILMHPRTISSKWEKYMLKLKMSYELHDFRHTWITKQVNTQTIPRLVQLAAGHKNIETTMGYVHNNNKFDSEIFIPKKTS